MKSNKDEKQYAHHFLSLLSPFHKEKNLIYSSFPGSYIAKLKQPGVLNKSNRSRQLVESFSEKYKISLKFCYTSINLTSLTTCKACDKNYVRSTTKRF